jgi:hypothetical protein
VFVSLGRLVTLRRKTINCCRSAAFSASSQLLDLNGKISMDKGAISDTLAVVEDDGIGLGSKSRGGAAMIVTFFIHEATALWDVSYATTARIVMSSVPASPCEPRAEQAEQEAARNVYDERRIPIATPAARVRHVLDCALAAASSSSPAVPQSSMTTRLLDEIRSIHAGGDFGSIIGRNSFQRPKEEALQMLGAVIDIYAAAPDPTRTVMPDAAPVDHCRAVDLVGGFWTSRRGGSCGRCGRSRLDSR